MKSLQLKTSLLIMLSFIAVPSSALTIFEDEYGHKIDLYGEVGTGGHFWAEEEYGEFFSDDTFIDDSFSSVGIDGTYAEVYYKLELDYERENFPSGSGDMVLTVDKSYFGYRITPNHAIEIGLTDTAFDDYDKFGDFTFDTTVETGEAGDQDNTVKYEGQFGNIKFASSYSYNGQSESGAELGNIYNGYIGYFGDILSVVVGNEGRVGSQGDSKYGQQKLFGFGLRLTLGDTFALGINGFDEEEYIAQESFVVDLSDPLNIEKRYNNFQMLERQGWLISSRFTFNERWEIVGSHNYEYNEEWDPESQYWDGTDYSWGKERTWQTLGVNYRPYPSVIIAAEANYGEAAQALYAYTRVYF